MECRICNNVYNLEIFEVREMMFGAREKFDYFLCTNCSTLQIKNIPINLSNYYPKDYYSLSADLDDQLTQVKVKPKSFFTILKSALYNILYSTSPDPIINHVTKFTVTRNDRILDIGCGKGVVLSMLSDLKYKNLIGVDPYLPNDILVQNKYSLLKKDILSLQGEWDLIMLHHVFEHLVNPKEILNHLKSLLSENGKILIRIPNVDSYAWRKYTTNWVQIDAPRHIHIFSIKSIGLMANKCGLKIVNIKFDSILFQFWGSEQYKRNISLHDSESYSVNPHFTSFSKLDFLRFRFYTFFSNLFHKGDQFSVVLEKDFNN